MHLLAHLVEHAQKGRAYAGPFGHFLVLELEQLPSVGYPKGREPTQHRTAFGVGVEQGQFNLLQGFVQAKRLLLATPSVEGEKIGEECVVHVAKVAIKNETATKKGELLWQTAHILLPLRANFIHHQILRFL